MTLTIRAVQMGILDDAFLGEWVRSELLQLFPKPCGSWTRDRMSHFIASGAKRSRDLQLTRNDLLPYLCMEISFGEDFVNDEANLWARQALQGPVETRMQRLRRAAVFYLAERVERERRQKNARAAARAQRAAEPRRRKRKEAQARG